MNKDRKAEKWAEAKRRCRLNEDDVRMAREMGLNPLSLIKNIPNRAQRWKAPVKEWIRAMYEKRHGRPRAEPIASPPRLPDVESRPTQPWTGEPDFDDIF